MTMDGTFSDIDDATSASYTPVEDDAGMYLQATASYTDGHGTGKMATSETVMVNADIVSGYNTNEIEGIQIDELLDCDRRLTSNGELNISDGLLDSHRGLLRKHRVTQPTVGCQVFSWYPTADDAVMCAARPHLIVVCNRKKYWTARRHP